MQRKWWTLLAVCVATFMLLLDVTVVNVAIPSIQSGLHASFSDIQWVVDAYAVMLAALLLTAGSLADRFGRRLLFTIGLVVFSLASLLCGLAGSPLALNLARGLQGIGGSIMFATSLALIAQEFHGRERGTAFGAWGATTGGAVAIGPLAGGAITQAASWHWIFFVNVPVGAVVVFISLTRLHESKDPRGARLDWLGLVSFSSALLLLVFALVRGNAKGWGSPQILALLIAAAVLLAIFVIVEWRTEHPMFDLGLFRKPTFSGASVVAFALSGSLFALFLYMTLYMQTVLDYGPLQTGLRFLAISLVSFVIAPIAGRMSAHLPVRMLLGSGLAFVAVGLGLMHGISASSRWTALLPGFILAGIGVGLVNPPLASTAIGVVPPARSGMASGINTTFRQVGLATGIAALGAVFQQRVQSDALGRLAATGVGHGNRASAIAHLLATGGVHQAVASASPALRGQVTTIARESFIAGFNEVIAIAAVVSLIGAICAFVLVRRRDFAPAPSAGAAPGALSGASPPA